MTISTIYRVSARDLSYWVPGYAEKKGTKPSSGFLLREDGSMLDFDLFENRNLPYEFNPMDFIAVIFWVPFYEEWSASYHRINGSVHQKFHKDLGSLIQDVFVSQQEEIRHFERLETDVEFALEEALKNHDWYYTYSDDYSVYSWGEKNWRKIQDLSKKVSSEVRDSLYKRYSPKYVEEEE